MSIDAVVKALSGLAEHSDASWTHPTLVGHFANVIDVGGVRIAIATDGVGTKHLLATKPEDFTGIAIDCAAMNVNDIICVGALPLAMVDYLAIESADEMEPYAAAIAEGFAEAERQGCGGIVGGEVAVLPEIIAPREDGVPGLDLAGTSIGIVDGKLLDGEAGAPGDVVIGVASSGMHSNGYTRIRRLVDDLECDLDAPAPWGAPSLREQLLVPTKLYPRLMEAVSGPTLHAAANITGGGITNLARVLPTTGVHLDAWPELPPLFAWAASELPVIEAFETFNMGVGFMLIVAAAAADDVLSCVPSDYEAWPMGVATDDVAPGHVHLDVGGDALIADRHEISFR